MILRIPVGDGLCVENRHRHFSQSPLGLACLAFTNPEGYATDMSADPPKYLVIGRTLHSDDLRWTAVGLNAAIAAIGQDEPEER